MISAKLYNYSNKYLFPGILISLLFAGVTYLQKNNAKELSLNKNINYTKQEKILETEVNFLQRLPEFGFDNIVGNWSYLQFIQYFGDNEAREVTGYSLTPEYFAAIVERDPYFIKAYLALSASNSIYAAKPEKTVEFLNEVLTHINPEKFPYASYLWSYKAVDELLFLGDTEAAEKSYRMAADWAIKRGDEEGENIAQRNLATADFLAKNPDSKYIRISAWSLILNNAQDDKTRRYVLEQLKALGAEIVVNSQGQLEIRLPEKDSNVSHSNFINLSYT